MTRCAMIRDLLRSGPKDLVQIGAAIGRDSRLANAYMQHLRRRGEARCVRRGDNGRFRKRAAVWEGVFNAPREPRREGGAE